MHVLRSLPYQSGRHIRIYQQQPYGFYIEQLGRNVSFLNSQRLAKGDVRTLQQGDEISVLNPPRSVGEAPEHQPFAVFVFRLTEPDGRQRPLKRLKMAEAVEPGATVAGPGDATCDVDDISVAGTDLSTLSTEEEFRAKYDMRIDIKNLIGKAGARLLVYPCEFRDSLGDSFTHLFTSFQFLGSTSKMSKS